MQLDFNKVKGTVFGKVVGAAVRAHLSKNPDLVQGIRLTGLNVEIHVNGTPIDMDLFDQILSAENNLFPARKRLAEILAQLQAISAIAKQANTADIARKIRDRWDEYLKSVDLTKVVCPPEQNAWLCEQGAQFNAMQIDKQISEIKSLLGE